jgi:hypothetical protein
MKIPKKLTIIALVSALAVTPITAFGTVFPAGSLLTSWNQDGVSIQGKYAYDAGLQSGTRAAAKDNAGRYVYGIVARPTGAPMASIERLLPSGEMDTSFDPGYIVMPDNSSYASWVKDLEVDSDNNVYAIVDELVIKLNGSNGLYDSNFGDAGFLDFNAGQVGGRFQVIAIAIDSNDNLYALGHKWPTNSNVGWVTTGENLVLKFDKDGNPSNFPQKSDNIVALPKERPNTSFVLIGAEDDEFGLMQFDSVRNSLILGGIHYVGETDAGPGERLETPSDLWLTRLNLESGEAGWDNSNDYWVSGFDNGGSSGYLYPSDLTIDPNGWVSIGGVGWTSGIRKTLVVQARPIESEQTYSVNQNGPIWLDPSDEESTCYVYSVMADTQNRLYTTGECTNSAFIHRYRSDGTLDTSFEGRDSSVVTGISGIFSPRYIVATDGELEIFGVGSNTEHPALTFVSKYRTVEYDDAPAVEPTTPAGEPSNSSGGSGTPALTPAPPAAKALPTLGVKKKLAGKSLATQIGMTVAPKAKVKLKVAKVSRKICKVSGGKLVALKPGNCLVTVSVTPKKTKQVKKPKTIKQSTVVVIS